MYTVRMKRAATLQKSFWIERPSPDSAQEKKTLFYLLAQKLKFCDEME